MSWPTETGRVYRVQHSTDLDEWQDMGAASVGDGATHVYTNTPSGEIGYYRIRVW